MVDRPFSVGTAVGGRYASADWGRLGSGLECRDDRFLGFLPRDAAVAPLWISLFRVGCSLDGDRGCVGDQPFAPSPAAAPVGSYGIDRHRDHLERNDADLPE